MKIRPPTHLSVSYLAIEKNAALDVPGKQIGGGNLAPDPGPVMLYT